MATRCTTPAVRVEGSWLPAFGAIRTERYKWIEYENGARALYDLESDPGERLSLMGSERQDATRLEELLAAHIESAKERSAGWKGDATVPKLSEKNQQRLRELGYVE